MCLPSSAYLRMSSRSCEEVEKADEEETVYHIKCATVNGDKNRDFVFLLSKRQPCKNGYDSTPNMTWFFFWMFIFNMKLKLYFYPHRDPYVIALRSVTLATVPPEENSIRSEAKCAGFLIHEMGYSTCKVPTRTWNSKTKKNAFLLNLNMSDCSSRCRTTTRWPLECCPMWRET